MTIDFQVGTFDPLPNARNEKLVSLNIHRIKYWIGERNANVTVSVLELLGMFSVVVPVNNIAVILCLGLAGLLPLHPKTFIRAKQNRKLLDEGLKRFKSSSKSQEDGSGAEEAPEQESVASGH